MNSVSNYGFHVPSLKTLTFSFSRKVTKPPPPLTLMPADVLLEIASYLDSHGDLLHFSTASSKLWAYLTPALYRKITLNGATQCIATLTMLRRTPDVSRHVQKLIVRPHLNKRGSLLRDGCVVAASVRKTAVRLPALHTFIWDGEDMCPYDDMWFALRMFCPRLRYIGTTMGSHVPAVNSHLFDFTGLTGFVVMLKPRFYHDHVDFFVDEEVPAYQKFWGMLINRCAGLEELSIEGISPHPADAAMLVKGHWPKLRKLHLGDVFCDLLVAAPQNPTGKRPFVEFLETHNALESLSISRHTIHPAHFSTLDPSALPNITEFEGTWEQLRALPLLHPSLKSVTFRDPILIHEMTPTAVAGTLQSLTSLAKLRLVLLVQTTHSSERLLQSLVSSCPNLRHLDLTCANKPSMHLESFAKIARNLTKLESFSLALMRPESYELVHGAPPGARTLSAGACNISRANPRIRSIRLTFLPRTVVLPLPFSLPLSLPPLTFSSARESGLYTPTCDRHGIPVSLAAHVRTEREWPLGLPTTRSTSRFVLDLRPPGHPSAVRNRLGLVGLLTERGRVGGECRILLLSAMVLVLSVCALWNAARGDETGRTQIVWLMKVDVAMVLVDLWYRLCY